MLHLAQVQEQDATGKTRLQLLAYQTSDHVWVTLSEPDSVCTEETGLSVGVLVLVELLPTRQVKQVQDAKPWILDIIDKYLSTGLTPALLQDEAQRAEQWRQSLTLQNQELGRRALEVEARRDQIQELEESLKQEKRQLEAIAAELKIQLKP
jgi:hypothetical protein